jgi:hypothetical protein
MVSPLSTPIHMLLEFLARAMRQKEEIKEIQIDKKEVKLSFFAHNIILYLKDIENSLQNSKYYKQLEQVARYKISSISIHQ